MDDDDFMQPQQKLSTNQVVFVSLMGFLVVVSVACNSLVVAVVARQPQLHNFPYIALSFIALIDVTDSFLILFFQILEVFTKDFPHKIIACRFYFYLPHVTSMAFAVCMCVLALVRWKGKKRLQFGEKKDVWKSVLLMLLVFLVAAAALLPYFYYSGLDKYGDVSYCVEEWSIKAKSIFHATTSVFKLIVISFIILISLIMARRQRNQRVVGVCRTSGKLMNKKRVEEGTDETKRPSLQMDKRFESMMVVVWAIWWVTEVLYATITPLLIFHYLSYSVVKVVVKVINVGELLWKVVKVLLYRGMDSNFRRMMNALLKCN